MLTRRRVLLLVAWAVWPAAVSFAALLAWPSPGLVAVAWLAAALLPAALSAFALEPAAARLPIVATLAGAAGLAWAVSRVIWRYWEFFGIRTPVSGLWLVFVVLPAAFLVTAVVGLGVGRRLRRAGARAWLTFAGVAIAMVAAAGALAALEFWQTADLRLREGGTEAPPPPLAPFLSSLLGRPG